MELYVDDVVGVLVGDVDRADHVEREVPLLAAQGRRSRLESGLRLCDVDCIEKAQRPFSQFGLDSPRDSGWEY